MRNGNSQQIPVTLEAMGARDKGSESASAGAEKPRWGLGLQDLTPDVRQQEQAGSSVQGAVVEKVIPGSSADDAGLQSGHIIQVNRTGTFSG